MKQNQSSLISFKSIHYLCSFLIPFFIQTTALKHLNSFFPFITLSVLIMSWIFLRWPTEQTKTSFLDAVLFPFLIYFVFGFICAFLSRLGFGILFPLHFTSLLAVTFIGQTQGFLALKSKKIAIPILFLGWFISMVMDRVVLMGSIDIFSRFMQDGIVELHPEEALAFAIKRSLQFGVGFSAMFLSFKIVKK